MPDINTIPAEQLEAALRRQAFGYLTAESALHLLISGDWLTIAAFREFVDYDDDPDVTGGEPMARVRWAEAVAALDSGKLRDGGAPGRMLRLAASFGGGIPVDLRENATNSLGKFHAKKVIEAVEHATTG